MLTPTIRFRGHGTDFTTSGIVTQADIDRVNAAARLQFSMPGIREVRRTCLHYVIDGHIEAKPIGKRGSKLEAVWEFVVEDDNGFLAETLGLEPYDSGDTARLTMPNVRFRPWIGDNYHAGSRFGARVLVMGISHHGMFWDKYHGVTADVVRRLGKGGRSSDTRFFGTMAAFLMNVHGAYLVTPAQRSDVWDDVAFYNFAQDFVGEYPGAAPKQRIWKESGQPFLEVVAALQPEIVVVAGATIAPHLPALPPRVKVCQVNHPRCFCYATMNPRFQHALAAVIQKRLVEAE